LPLMIYSLQPRAHKWVQMGRDELGNDFLWDEMGHDELRDDSS
jgi:hypothetical protein